MGEAAEEEEDGSEAAAAGAAMRSGAEALLTATRSCATQDEQTASRLQLRETQVQ